MIKEDTIIELDDNKEYYVLDSLMNDSHNFIMISEIDAEKDELTDNVKIMYYDPEIKTLRKVTDSNSLYQLTQLFAEREMSGNA